MLFTKLPAVINTFSPLHIASGKEDLFLDYDFLRQEDQILVMDIDKMLQVVDVRRLKSQLEPKITNLITPSQYSQCLAYKLKIIGPTPQRIVTQQKDVLLHPYIPGSSIKGALRTTLLWHHWQNSLKLEKLDPQPKYSFSLLERNIFGYDPQHDLLRALKISDFFPLKSLIMQALEIRTYTLSGQPPQLKPHPNPRLTTWVEAIPENTQFIGEICLDNYLLEDKKLGFHPKSDWLRQFQVSCYQFAQLIAKTERQFYKTTGALEIAGFYEKLHQQIVTLTPNQFPLQLAWGTGWHTKTIGTKLSSTEIRQIVRKYKLDRGRNYPIFPKTRRLAQKENKPFAPLGWTIITLKPE